MNDLIISLKTYPLEKEDFKSKSLFDYWFEELLRIKYEDDVIHLADYLDDFKRQDVRMEIASLITDITGVRE